MPGCLPLVFLALGSVPATGGEPAPIPEKTSGYTALVRSHLDRLTRHSFDTYGRTHTRMWLATIDTTTGGLPAKPLPRQLRWYRKITSPSGSNLYWDQPTILAAYALSELTHDARYAASADGYIREFLGRCVDDFHWYG